MKRSPGIEALRCLLMFLIVLGHCCNYGPYAKTPAARGLVGMTVFSVNTFVLISGWFGISFSWRKVARLCTLGAFAAGVLMVISWFYGEASLHFSLGWFGNSYLALLFLSPLLNAGIDALRQESQRALISAWMCYTLIMFIQWFPMSYLHCNLSVTGWNGVSFNTLCYVYVTGRVLKTLDVQDKISSRWVVVLFALQILIIQVCRALSGFSANDSILRAILTGAFDYNSPLVITTSICLFLLFAKITMPVSIGRMCIFMAPSMFSIYLLHEGTNPAVSRHLYTTYCFLMNGGNGIACVLDLLAATVIVFVATLSVDLLRRGFISMTMHATRKLKNQ